MALNRENQEVANALVKHLKSFPDGLDYTSVCLFINAKKRTLQNCKKVLAAKTYAGILNFLTENSMVKKEGKGRNGKFFYVDKSLLPQLFKITAKNKYFLAAFGLELYNKLGIDVHHRDDINDNDAMFIDLQSNDKEKVFNSSEEYKDSFTIHCTDRINYPIDPSNVFELPKQWDEAFEFVKKQVESNYWNTIINDRIDGYDVVVNTITKEIKVLDEFSCSFSEFKELYDKLYFKPFTFKNNTIKPYCVSFGCSTISLESIHKLYVKIEKYL